MMLLEKHKEVENMFEDGILKIGMNGKYEAVRDENEAESIRSEVSKSKRRQNITAADAEQINVQL